jgi:tetratricopeptide (TPR) repeat protein
MSADTRALMMALAVVAALVVSVPSLSASPEARDAVERARALEESGRHREARAYLSGLVASDERLAEEAAVLLELARLTTDADTLTVLLDAAVEAARRPEEIATAHMMRGDLLYARGRYTAAAEEYGRARRAAPAFRPGSAALKRAESLLGAGDGSAALAAFEELVNASGTTEETRPWAELGRARALLETERYEEAARAFEAVAAERSEHDVRPLALAGAADARGRLDDRRAVIELLTSLVEEYPGTLQAALAADRLSRTAPPDTFAPDTTTTTIDSR